MAGLFVYIPKPSQKIVWDVIPDDFTFTSTIDSAISDYAYSDIIGIVGLTGTAHWSVSGGEMSVNGGAWASSGTLTQGSLVQVRILTTGDYLTQFTASVIIGGKLGYFSTTTIDQPIQPPSNNGYFIGMYQPSYTRTWGAAIDSANNAYMLTSLNDSTYTGMDLHLTKFDPNGVVLWTNTLSNTTGLNFLVASLAVAPDDMVYIAYGRSNASTGVLCIVAISSDGNIAKSIATNSGISTTQYPPISLKIGNDLGSGYPLIYSTLFGNLVITNFFTTPIIKSYGFSKSGVSYQAYAVAALSDNSRVTTVRVNTGSDTAVIKMSPTGTTLLNRTFNYASATSETMPNLVVDSSDNIYVVGTQYGTVNTSYGIWLIKLNSNLDVIWQKGYEIQGTIVNETGTDIATDGQYLYVSGTTLHGSFGAGWIGCLDFDGAIVWQKDLYSPNGTVNGLNKIAVDSTSIFCIGLNSTYGTYVKIPKNGVVDESALYTLTATGKQYGFGASSVSETSSFGAGSWMPTMTLSTGTLTATNEPNLVLLPATLVNAMQETVL